MKTFQGPTSAPIGAWMCEFTPFQKIMTDRPSNQPTEQTEGHREVSNGVQWSYNLIAVDREKGQGQKWLSQVRRESSTPGANKFVQAWEEILDEIFSFFFFLINITIIVDFK